MNIFKRKRLSNQKKSSQQLKNLVRVKSGRKPLIQTTASIERMLQLSGSDINSGKYKMQLYRFLMDNIPVINSCIWTWVRLASSGGKFIIDGNKKNSEAASSRLKYLSKNLYQNIIGNRTGMVSFQSDLFEYLFRDGIFGGFITVKKDGSGVDRFVMVDPINIRIDSDGKEAVMIYETENQNVKLNRPDFYFIPLSNDMTHPLGRSMLQAVPFVSYIEQQLVDDMRRSSHNSGFHRLHVKVTPPDRFAGESETAYVNRINNYFDSTVNMIKSCEVDENPVTWDNVLIESIGPGNARSVTNSWFMNHRAMVEEICAGTNLSPFLLGYSYGATTTWSGFKFDMVMRQIKSVQAEVANFFEWIGNIELALAGFNSTCRFIFDNDFTYRLEDDEKIRSSKVDNIIKLLDNGLIDIETAKLKIQDYI